MKTISLISTLLLCAAGCATRRIMDPNTGATIYESKRFGNKERFDRIQAQYVTPEGHTNTILIVGYISDQVESIKALKDAFESMAAKGGKAMVAPGL